MGLHPLGLRRSTRRLQSRLLPNPRARRRCWSRPSTRRSLRRRCRRWLAGHRRDIYRRCSHRPRHRRPLCRPSREERRTRSTRRSRCRDIPHSSDTSSDLQLRRFPRSRPHRCRRCACLRWQSLPYPSLPCRYRSCRLRRPDLSSPVRELCVRRIRKMPWWPRGRRARSLRSGSLLLARMRVPTFRQARFPPRVSHSLN